MRAATVVQVLQDVLQLFVVAAILFSFIANLIACFILLVIGALLTTRTSSAAVDNSCRPLSIYIRHFSAASSWQLDVVSGRRTSQWVPDHVLGRLGPGVVQLGLDLRGRRRRETTVVHDVAVGVRQSGDAGGGFAAAGRHGTVVATSRDD